MKAAVVALYIVLAAATAAAQPAYGIRKAELCECLLDARRLAEAQGRLDFSAVVDVVERGGWVDLIPRVHMGSAHMVGRITFSGHQTIDESTLRRMMVLHERDLFDVGKLRRSLSRLNASGLFEPLALADLGVAKHVDGVTADLAIPLRERRRRWWSLSGPLVPGLGSYQASISSRLPPWGRGVFNASTYYVTFNLIGLARPLLNALPFASAVRGAPVLVLERPYLPGQGLLSGFAVAPTLSPRSLLAEYGATHLARGARAALDAETTDALAVPMTAGGRADGALLVCEPPKPRLAWLRRGAMLAVDMALAAGLLK